MTNKRYRLSLESPHYTGDSYKLFIEGNLYLDFGSENFIWKSSYDWNGLIWLIKSYCVL